MVNLFVDFTKKSTELLIFTKENQCNERGLGETISILLRVSLREANDGRSLGLNVQHGEIICLYMS